MFDHSQSVGLTRLVLLAIADRADNKGLAYPSVADIARRANISERSVYTAIEELRRLGELEVDRARGGTLPGHKRRGRTNLYRLTDTLQLLAGHDTLQNGGDTLQKTGHTLQPLADEPSYRTVNRTPPPIPSTTPSPLSREEEEQEDTKDKEGMEHGRSPAETETVRRRLRKLGVRAESVERLLMDPHVSTFAIDAVLKSLRGLDRIEPGAIVNRLAHNGARGFDDSGRRDAESESIREAERRRQSEPFGPRDGWRNELQFTQANAAIRAIPRESGAKVRAGAARRLAVERLPRDWHRYPLVVAAVIDEARALGLLARDGLLGEQSVISKNPACDAGNAVSGDGAAGIYQTGAEGPHKTDQPGPSEGAGERTTKAV